MSGTSILNNFNMSLYRNASLLASGKFMFGVLLETLVLVIGYFHWYIWWLLKKPFLCYVNRDDSLLAAGVLCDCFSSLANSMFCEFTRQQETNSSLDFPRCDGRFLVVMSQS